MTNPTHVWLAYPETGGKARMSVESAEVWQARGWMPCDPPDEPDITKEPNAEPPEPESADAADGTADAAGTASDQDAASEDVAGSEPPTEPEEMNRG